MALISIGYLALFLLAPACWLWLEPRIRIVNWLSPAFFSYLTGILACNLLETPADLVQGFIIGSVALAIPLLLLPTDIYAWLKAAPQALGAFGLFVVLLTCVSLGMGALFSGLIDLPSGRAGMAAAVYTGGSANMAAVHAAGQLPAVFLPEMTMADLITSGIYLGVALSLAPFIGRKYHEDLPASASPALAIPAIGGQFAGLRAWLAAGSILAAAGGSSWLFFGEINETYTVAALTLLGLAASVFKPVREAKGAYFTGEYLFLAFCVATGSLVNARMLLEGGPIAIAFMMCTGYGTVAVFLFMARLFRIPWPLALITTVAGMFSPPFIGPVAQSLRQRKLAPIGMTLAVMGLALGNLIGLLVSWIGKALGI